MSNGGARALKFFFCAILYADAFSMLCCAHFIYVSDVRLCYELPDDSNLNTFNSKTFFFLNCVTSFTAFGHLMSNRNCFISLWLLFIIIHQISRIIFAYYFYFFLNLPNLIGFFLGLYYVFKISHIQTREIQENEDYR